jgi:UDP-N-acetylmuramate--alanine ligase
VRVVTYGMAADADLRVDGFTPRGLGCRFGIDFSEAAGGGAAAKEVALIELTVPGRHNALNATAAFAAAQVLGCDLTAVRDGLAGFGGAMRRLELKGEAGGAQVFDSYAHHPTELIADLQATRDYVVQRAQESGAPGRIVAVFQPHLYSRTKFFVAEFGAALALADVAVVLDVYGAREDPEPGVTGRLIADAVPPGGTEVSYLPEQHEAPDWVARLALPGDVIITLGAGDVTKLGPLILERLAR